MVGEAVEVTHIQGEATATAAAVTADVWWVGGTKKCERPEAAAHFLIFDFFELDQLGRISMEDIITSLTVSPVV